MGTELEFTEGMQFDKGYISAYFVSDPESMEAVLEDPYILLHQGKISGVAELLPLLEKVIASGKPLFILAEDVEGEALSTLVVNKIRGTFNAVAVKAPAFGDRRKAMMQDIATLTGGQVVAPEVGLKLDQVGLDVLGTARRVVVTKDNTTIVDGGGEAAEVDGPGQPDQGRDREHRLRLGPREAPGAAGQAGRRRLRHQGRRRHRGGAEGEEAPHRGRRLGDPRGHRGGHRPRRWHCARSTRPRSSTATSASTATRPIGVHIVRKAARRAAALDRRERRRQRLRRRRQGPRGRCRQRLQRRHRRVRRPGRPGRARPGQGDPLRAGQRHLDRRHAADDRDPDRREARGARSPPRPAATATATATDATHDRQAGEPQDRRAVARPARSAAS